MTTKKRSELITLINTNLPTNSTNFITPDRHRAVLEEIVDNVGIYHKLTALPTTVNEDSPDFILLDTNEFYFKNHAGDAYVSTSSFAPTVTGSGDVIPTITTVAEITGDATFEVGTTYNIATQAEATGTPTPSITYLITVNDTPISMTTLAQGTLTWDGTQEAQDAIDAEIAAGNTPVELGIQTTATNSLAGVTVQGSTPIVLDASMSIAITTPAQLPTDQVYESNQVFVAPNLVTQPVITGTPTTVEYRYEVDPEKDGTFVAEGGFLTSLPTNAPATTGSVDGDARLETIVDRGLPTEVRGYSNEITTTAPLTEISSLPSVIESFDIADAVNDPFPFSQDFETTAVDLVNNTIAYDNSVYDFTNDLDGSNWTPVTFTEGGALPTPLVEGKLYLFWDKNADGNATVYEYLTDADYATHPAFDEGQFVPPAQNASEDLNAINFTDVGVGTNSFATNDLLTTFASDGGGIGFAETSTRINDFMEVIGSGSNRRLLNRGVLTRTPDAAESEFNGKTVPDNISNAAFSALYSGKRYVGMIAVGKPSVAQSNSSRYVRGDSSKIDVALNQLSNGRNHNMSTGDYYEATTYPGATLPTGLPVSGYVRRVSSFRLTFHPTADDAVNNNNAADLTDTGTGFFIIKNPAKVGSTVGRNQYLIDWNYADGTQHMITPSFSLKDESVNMDSVTTWYPDTGEMRFTFEADELLDDGSLRVSIWFPEGSTRPIADDTGLALENGDYWMNVTPNPGFNPTRIRFFRTEADAIAAEGLVTSDPAVNTITFSTRGSGEFGFALHPDNPFYEATDQDLDITDFGVVGDERAVFTGFIDFTPDAGTNVFTSAGVNSLDNLFSGEHRDTAGLVTGTNGSVFLFNAAQPHVPLNSESGNFVFFASDTDPRDDMQAALDTLMATKL